MSMSRRGLTSCAPRAVSSLLSLPLTAGAGHRPPQIAETIHATPAHGAEMRLIGAYFFVIPEWSAGPGPEPMNTGRSQVGRGLCSWVPGSRAAPEPRNDQYFG